MFEINYLVKFQRNFQLDPVRVCGGGGGGSRAPYACIHIYR
jgi:hypothetical protein